MARFEMEFPENLLEGLDDLIEEVAPKMIEEALPIYKDSIEKSVKNVLSNAPENIKRRTGSLEKSVCTYGPKETSNGAYIGILTFNGASEKTVYKRKKGNHEHTEPFRNYQKALALEYGNSHQVARPFMDNAKNSCESKVIETMQSVFDREVDVT